MLQKITDLYSNGIQTHISASSLLPECISQAAQRIVDCLLQGHKIVYVVMVDLTSTLNY